MTTHPDYKRKFDAAGHFFDAFYRRKVLNEKDPEEGEEEQKKNPSDDEEEKDEAYSKEYIENMEKKRKKKLQDKLTDGEEETHYQVLGLGEKGMDSTDDDIKKAYRKMALIHHPDKKKNDGEEKPSGETDPMWLKIQNAYETLTDGEKRKKYDAQLPFDESIPEGEVDESDFFDVYKSVF